ncbi:dTDP-4-dehydrorhamnose reductase [Tardiphaga sp. vice278]|uniref:dTDP-4-dehydrorhamnose reductase n=1 Tax=Tardiphaga sp. vice278 TaxID=2592815 RepID=UPI0011657200|nr:dTDP-4-dehydrorhamnose reductase [Tardiphaga sp. vice278]QDM17941.1 dTDP-4-dehydrorhamnose reductase [Tardiphaga sp. vice278]
MRVFVFGAEGQVARSLREAAAGRSDVVLATGGRPDVDLLNAASVEAAVAAFQPDIVVNPAAYTAVDKAETEPDSAFAVNRDGAGFVAAAAARRGVPVIHLSTDYVFDGQKASPYSEDDVVSPKSVYGRSKLEGERAVAAANPQHVVVRTAWVYSPFGSNFVRTMLRLAAERDRISVVDDQIGCPTSAADIAHGVMEIARQLHENGWQDSRGGVLNLVGPDAMTWCDFARMIIQMQAERGGRLIPVDSISASDYPTLASRPANSRLSTARLNSLFGIRLPPTARSLELCLDRLTSGIN